MIENFGEALKTQCSDQGIFLKDFLPFFNRPNHSILSGMIFQEFDKDIFNIRDQFGSEILICSAEFTPASSGGFNDTSNLRPDFSNESSSGFPKF